MTDIWDLIFTGRYEEALPALIEEDWSSGHNLGKIFLALDRLDEAEEAFRRTPEETSSHCVMLGACASIRGCHEDALSLWQKAQEAPYQDAAGGVIPRALCFYASLHLGDARERKAALSSLKSVWKPKRTGWPVPIAGFLLGKYPEDEFTWHEINSPSDLGKRRKVQLDFWKGVVRLKDGDVLGASNFFSRAYSPNGVGILEVEHFLARNEVRYLRRSSTE